MPHAVFGKNQTVEHQGRYSKRFLSLTNNAERVLAVPPSAMAPGMRLLLRRTGCEIADVNNCAPGFGRKAWLRPECLAISPVTAAQFSSFGNRTARLAVVFLSTKRHGGDGADFP
jgi:hypothetical protein